MDATKLEDQTARNMEDEMEARSIYTIVGISSTHISDCHGSLFWKVLGKKRTTNGTYMPTLHGAWVTQILKAGHVKSKGA